MTHTHRGDARRFPALVEADTALPGSESARRRVFAAAGRAVIAAVVVVSSPRALLPSAQAACEAWVAMPVDCALLSVSAGRRFGDQRRVVCRACLDRLRGRG